MTKGKPVFWCLSVWSSYVLALSLFLSTVYSTTGARVTSWGKKNLLLSKFLSKIRQRESCFTEWIITHYVQFLLFLSGNLFHSTWRDFLLCHPLPEKTVSLVTEMIRYHSVIQSPKLRHLMNCRCYRVSPSCQFAVSDFLKACVITVSLTEILYTVWSLSCHERFVSEN